MATRVLQAAVGSGKTEAALRTLTGAVNDAAINRLPHVWLLFATNRQQVAFRQRLIDLDDDHSVYCNVEFFNIYSINDRILKMSHQPVRRISERARLGILRLIMRELRDAGQLSLLGAEDGLNGMVSVVADVIYELKQNLIAPQTFADAAVTPKDHDVARIYTEYQAQLQAQRLVDREGIAWLARDALAQRSENLPVDLVIVDGFDQFTRVQSDIIAYLSASVPQLVLTLTGVEGDRSRIIGQRFHRALERLNTSHERAGVSLHVERLPDNARRHAELDHLTATIGNPDAPPLTPQEMPSRVRLIEAPEPADEIAEVLRAVKEMLLHGVTPDEIMIAVHDWQRYQPHIVRCAGQFDVPVLTHIQQSILENPALSTVMRAIRLTGSIQLRSFRRRDVLDLLRSPYVSVGSPAEPDESRHLPADKIDLLDQITRDYFVISGRESWFEAIESASAVEQVEQWDDEDADDRVQIDAEQAAELSNLLEDFFSVVSMPPEATRTEYARRIERLIGPDTMHDERDEHPLRDDLSLNILANISDAPAHVVARDRRCLRAMLDLLRSYVGTDDLVRDAFNQPPERIAWRDFVVELEAALKHTMIEPQLPTRTGRVLVTGTSEARGLPHAHIFVTGLSESIFPARQSEDVLYSDTERQRIRERIQHIIGDEQAEGLQTLEERANDEGIFYEIISAAQQTLTLSRPTVRDGKPWLPGYLWRWTTDVFSNLTHVNRRSGQVTPAEFAASIDEALLAAANADDERAGQIRRWLQEQPDYALTWAHIQRGIDVEGARMSRNQPDAYSGVLADKANAAYVAEALSDRRRWSATQFREYGMCPYGFFAKRILKLEAFEEPAEGMDQLQLGSLNHEILEHTYNAIIEEGFAIAPAYLPDALEIFDEVAGDLLDDAPQRHHFKPNAVWEQLRIQLQRRLRIMIEQDFTGDSPFEKLNAAGESRYPYRMELTFNLPVKFSDDLTLYVRGQIDRVDRVGNRLIVVDYKTGSSKISPSDLMRGQQFQMLIYKAALESWLAQANITDLTAWAGFFWHIRNQEASSMMQFGDDAPEGDLDALNAGAEHLRRYTSSARRGHFPAVAATMKDGKCYDYCQYYQLCRLMATNQYKPVEGN